MRANDDYSFYIYYKKMTKETSIYTTQIRASR